MSDYLIGAGGWAYFKIPNKVSLKAYSEIFNFVEVNYTFYQYPTTETVYKWRRTVPKQFTFSVRCNQELTHKIGLRPVNESYQTLYQMRTYCEILHSPYLVLETPAEYVMNQDNIDDAKEFFSTINLKGINLVWELRAPINQAVTSLMQDFNIIHCVDLSKERPSYNSDITYSRLFGKGQHNLYQFTDNELVEIDQKTKDINSKTVILSYHGMRMNTDAQRFLQYKKTGDFMPVTSYVGLDSAKAVLAEDAEFPSSKAELEQKQGWKVIDLTLDKRTHLSEFLNKIPNKTYANLDEVINELRGVL